MHDYMFISILKTGFILQCPRILFFCNNRIALSQISYGEADHIATNSKY